MKNLGKALIAFFAVFGAIIGALAIFDKLSNKNRIKGDYLECDTEEYSAEVE
ncbi:MAG: hypothetical protein IKD04_08160 [Clostridia bacterium]|nr:hypothetical protein [Clostridia bacterium]